MNEVATIADRIDKYLTQILDINHRWLQWLSDSERAVAKLDVDGLSALSPTADALMHELSSYLEIRADILNDARGIGLHASGLASLARSLPAGRDTGLREKLKDAQRQQARLQRLHASTWVLIRQFLNFYGNTMNLLTEGRSERAAYTPNPNSDIGGGRLLDASL